MEPREASFCVLPARGASPPLMLKGDILRHKEGLQGVGPLGEQTKEGQGTEAGTQSFRGHPGKIWKLGSAAHIWPLQKWHDSEQTWPSETLSLSIHSGVFPALERLPFRGPRSWDEGKRGKCQQGSSVSVEAFLHECAPHCPCLTPKGDPSPAREAEWRLPVPLFLEKEGSGCQRLPPWHGAPSWTLCWQ